MKSKLCETCAHTKVCMRDKNMVGDVYVAPHPLFFDEEYKQKAWENYKEREKMGFPCDEYQADGERKEEEDGY